MAELTALATAEQLASFPGAPFAEQRVLAAGDRIRAACGWHIAPEIEQTMRIDLLDRVTMIRLRTRRIVELIEVQDTSGDEPQTLTGVRWSADGMLQREAGFPTGLGALLVVLRHGYETCPADLLPVIAENTTRRILQESIGARSLTLEGSTEGAIDPLAPYRLGPEA